MCVSAQQNNSPYTNLVWSDEFNGEGVPDPAKWGYEVGYIRNGELQYYTEARAENAFQQDGYLHLKVIYNDPIYDESGTLLNHKEGNITSASIMSKDKGDWKYGRFEIRAKVPGPNKGSWPGIWMMPTENGYGGWPNSGEIDIMEHVGYSAESVHFTCHTANRNGANAVGHSITYNVYDDFHTYILEWYEDRLEWYIDDKKMPVHEFYRPSLDSKDWPFRRIFYMILSFSYGGGWGGRNGVDVTKLPLEILVDYVRVYQAPPDTSVASVEKDAISLYPNPVKDILNIGDGSRNFKEACILSMNGQRLMKSTNSNAMDLSSLSGGSYLIELTDADSNTVIRKIFKE
jgi:beta-glucanase (GH16 family)